MKDSSKHVGLTRLKKFLPSVLAILVIAAACYFIPPLFAPDSPGTVHGINPSTTPASTSAPSTSPSPKQSDGMRTIRIYGAVERPGEYTLPADYELIQYVNLAQPKIDADTSDKALLKPPPAGMTEYRLPSYQDQ